jgi:general stress protein 26
MSETRNGQELHPSVLELARGQNFAALTTLLPSGHPQTQVMWVDADGRHLLINTPKSTARSFATSNATRG